MPTFDNEPDELVERLVGYANGQNLHMLGTDVRQAADALVALRAERDGLRRYAQHLGGCPRAAFVGVMHDTPCACGLAELSNDGRK